MHSEAAASPDVVRLSAGDAGRRGPAWLRYFVYRAPLALLGAALLIFICLCTLFAPVIAPYDPLATDVTQRFLLPSAQHWFGTDNLGRDVFARVLFGGQPVLVTGVSTVLAALIVGVAIGAISGYQGGWWDNLLMRLMDVMLSFPSVLLAILIVATIGRGQQNVIIAIAFSMVPVFARLVRASVMSVKVEEYVTSARTLGATDSAILRRHVLPNILAPILVQATALLAVAISTATALNFIGLGVQPPDPDWGLMVSEGQKLLYDAPHVGFFPGIVITLTVLSANFLGDGLRDYLDPKLRRSQ